MKSVRVVRYISAWFSIRWTKACSLVDRQATTLLKIQYVLKGDSRDGVRLHRLGSPPDAVASGAADRAIAKQPAAGCFEMKQGLKQVRHMCLNCIRDIRAHEALLNTVLHMCSAADSALEW